MNRAHRSLLQKLKWLRYLTYKVDQIPAPVTFSEGMLHPDFVYWSSPVDLIYIVALMGFKHHNDVEEEGEAPEPNGFSNLSPPNKRSQDLSNNYIASKENDTPELWKARVPGLRSNLPQGMTTFLEERILTIEGTLKSAGLSIK